MAQPTQAAIDLLRKNPAMADQFDEVFGKGAHAAYVQPAKAGILDTLGSVASDIGTGITEAPRAIVRGTENAVNETSNVTKEVADHIQAFAAQHGVDAGHIQYDFTHGAPKIWWAPGMAQGPNHLQVPDAITPNEPTSTTGHLIEGVSQFTAGMAGAGKFLKAAGVAGEATTALGKFGLTAAKAGIADATVFDPHAERLSNLIEANPALQNPVTSFLAAKPTDGEAVGRLKNSVEGFLGGTAAEAFVHGVRAIKLARGGDLKGAAQAAEDAGNAHAAANPPPPDGGAGGAVATPPPADGTVRFFHGSKGVDPAAGGSRWVTTDQTYARDFRAGDQPNDVHYVDLPKGHPSEVAARQWDNMDEAGGTNMVGRYGHVEVPEDVAKQMQPYKAADEAAPAEAQGAQQAADAGAADATAAPAEASDTPPKATDANGETIATPPTGETTAAVTKRDVMNVGAKPLPFRLEASELDQYGKNLDARFTVGGQEMANTGAHFNFSKINTTDDIKAAINSMANVVQDKLPTTRSWGDVQRNAKTIADVVGGDPRLLIQHMSTMSQSVEHLDSFMKASGDMLVSLSSHSDKLAQMMVAETPGEFGDMKTLAGAYNHSVQLLGNNYALLKNIQTNVARAQNAGKITRQINPIFKGGVEAIGPEDEWMLKTLARRQAAAAGGAADEVDAAASTRKLLEGSLFDRALAVHNEFWFNAVLSGVKTHVVNNVVNTAKTLFMPAEQMVAGIIGRNSAQFKEGAYQYAGIKNALADSFAMAKKAFQVQDNVLDYRGAYEGVHKQAITAAMFGAENNNPVASLINGIGTLTRIPTRMLMAEDEFFKQINYRSRIYANAMREGMEQGLNPSDTGELVAKRLKEAVDPAGHATTVDEFGKPVASRVQALQQAREATFTQPLGENTLGRWIEAGAQAHPSIRIIMPFVRVPTNIMRDVWQHTPGLGMVQKQMREDLAAGGERASMALAKQTTGAAMWSLAAAAAYEGKITGYGPVDPQQRKAWLLQNQPYSYVHTDSETGKKTFVAFNRLDPYSIPFGMAADFAHIAGQLGEEDKDTFATAALLSIVNNLASKTYLQGLIQAVNVLSDDRGTKIDQFLEQRAASYVPNILGAANPDPYLREARGVLDAMRAKIPGFSETLPPRRDIMGEPMTVPMGYPFDQLNPFTVKSAEPDPAKDEMARLSASNAGIRFPMPPKQLDGLDLTQVKDADGVSAYDKWQQNIGETTIGGRTLHDKLNETVQKPTYQDAADGNSVYKKSRKVDMIQHDLDRYRQHALRDTLKDYPEAQQALHEFKKGSKRVRAGQAPGDDPFAVFNQ